MFNKRSSIKVLYISYDGLLDSLGKSQITPYIKELAVKGVTYVLLTFEKKSFLSDKNAVIDMEKELDSFGIIWKRLIYHNGPRTIMASFDIFLGIFHSIGIARRYRVGVVHARGYIPSLIAIILRKFFKVKFIFDMRGLWPDEKVDAGSWKKKDIAYKVMKVLEKIIFKTSDYIVVLSSRGEGLIKNTFSLPDKVCVIPTCTDLNLFRIKDPRMDIGNNIMNKGERFIFAYVGSLGSWYMLEEMSDFFMGAREYFGNPFFLLIANDKHEIIRSAMEDRKISPSEYYVRKLDYRRVSDALNIADVSVFFIRPVMSKIVSCPTKFGESLACGIPVVINSGIGDTAEIVNRERVGVVIEEFSSAAYGKAMYELNKLLEDRDSLRQRCRHAAEKYFSLDSGVARYMKIYNNLIST